MPTKTKRKPPPLSTFRLSDDDLTDLDLIVVDLAKHTGFVVTRVAAVRWLIREQARKLKRQNQQ